MPAYLSSFVAQHTFPNSLYLNPIGVHAFAQTYPYVVSSLNSFT